MPTTAIAPTDPITESRFNALKFKLRELFELDKSDLDFGIYRIMAAKNDEVNDFLEKQLKSVVSNILAQHGSTTTDTIQQELDAAIQQAAELGADPDTLPKVQELKVKLAAAGPTSTAELEADIYNHLLTFFSRYYDEGDFISKRRYKGDTYAIPYAGEEVVLHWANKDQYYIKSGEWHKDYRFRAGKNKSIRFKLVQATQETNNNKENNNAKRRYILDHDNPIEETNSELTLRFQFRAPTEEEKKSLEESEPTRIFGGKYDKTSARTKGDEREQFAADAEIRALEALSSLSPTGERAGVRGETLDKWYALLAAPSSTPSKPNRSILGKHLNDFTAKNTFDYFIHKDLGRFLSRELDFYIKNEVVRLDDLETLPPDHLARVQGKIKAIRTVASRIIDFLASLENFQKKLWLKKKLILETNWLVTIDRIPSKLRDVVAANEKQWEEWEKLGFKPEGADDNDTELFANAEWASRAYLDTHDKLVVDTRFFDHEFETDLLASEEILGEAESLDDATTGILMNGDNFHALSLIDLRYRNKVQYVYIDPPYNAKSSEIPYKNTYKHSAWLSLIENRFAMCAPLISNDGCLTIAIDDNEQERLGLLLKLFFPNHESACITVVHNPAGVQGVNFSYTHEYAFFVYPSTGEYIGYTNRDSDLVSQLRDWGGTSARSLAKNCFYPIIVKDNKIIGFGNCCHDDFHPGAANVQNGDEIYIYPVEGTIDSENYEERKWVFSRNSVETNANQLFVRENKGEIVIMRRKSMRKYRTVWDDKKYYANIYGSKLLSQIMGSSDFSFPKAVPLIEDSIKAIISMKTRGADVLDYFAGSGTTGHAVINLNREDNGSRRFILVEMGAYFHTVLKPRITKVIYSPDWKDGKAKTHDKGVSALVKYFALESYDDALNNLPAPGGELFAEAEESVHDAMISYSLDLELGPHLLDLDIFRDPWGYSINAQLAGEDEIKSHGVDLVETFNYLLGLKVRAYGPIERYSAEFERAKHEDDLGRLKVKGRLKRDPDGLFIFQRIEGELNDDNDTRVLVVWRKLTGDGEQDAAVLEAWMKRHRENTKERSEYRDYQQIYLNGPVTLPQPTQEIRTVYSTEEAFKKRMFEDSEGGIS